jgi:hypothetical protein
MNYTAYRGVVRGGVVVLLEPESPLGEGTEVLVTPVASPRGSPVAVLAAMKAEPQVPAEWVDELERLIAEGRRPPARPEPFREERDPQEGP